MEGATAAGRLHPVNTRILAMPSPPPCPTTRTPTPPSYTLNDYKKRVPLLPSPLRPSSLFPNSWGREGVLSDSSIKGRLLYYCCTSAVRTHLLCGPRALLCYGISGKNRRGRRERIHTLQQHPAAIKHVGKLPTLPSGSRSREPAGVKHRKKSQSGRGATLWRGSGCGAQLFLHRNRARFRSRGGALGASSGLDAVDVVQCRAVLCAEVAPGGHLLA